MEFGNTTKCHICKKETDGNCHRYTCDIAGIDMAFYTHHGDCDKEFRGEYVTPFESIDNRFEILDL